MKIQIAFRDLGHRENDMNVVACIGLMEFRRLQMPSEMIGTFEVVVPLTSDADVHPTTILNHNLYRTPRDKYEDVPMTADCDISSAITKPIWHTPNLGSNGQFFLRETRIEPSRKGFAVMAFSGVVGINPSIAIDQDSILQYSKSDDAIFEFEGKVGHDINPSWRAPAMREKMRGNSMMAFLRYPVWGFGEEPVCLPSTMHLEFADMADEFRLLNLLTDRSSAEEDRFNELLPIMKRSGLFENKDKQYRLFQIGMMERGLVTSSASPRTRNEEAGRDKIASEVIVEVLTAEAKSDGLVP